MLSSFSDAMNAARKARDVMSAAAIAALGQLEADLEREGWDAPPRLFIVYRDLMPTELSNQIGLEAMLFRFNQLGPAPFGRSGPEIADRLDVVATALATMDPAKRDAMAPPTLFGFALCHEGWTTPRTTDAEQIRQDTEDARAHRVHTRTDRVEIRNAVLVDLTGNGTSIVRTRGDADAERLVTAEGLMDGARLGGSMVDALRAVLRGSQGVPADELYDEVDLDMTRGQSGL